MNKNNIKFKIGILVIICGGILTYTIYNLITTNYMLENKIHNQQKMINQLQHQNVEVQNLYNTYKEKLIIKDRLIQQKDNQIEEYKHKLASLEQLQNKPVMNSYNGWEMIWKETYLEDWEIDFFAKLLKAESGGMGYEGQFWTASAILNLSERSNSSIYTMGHNINTFAVAPFVDNVSPDDIQYQIIYNVLKNGWIKDVCYFRTDYPHNFGRFMRQIENVYFNAPN